MTAMPEHHPDHASHDHAPHDHGGEPHSELAHTHLAIAHMREQTLLLAVGLTGGFMVVEFVAGWIAGSLALMADALHMLTDAAALGLALFAVMWSRKHADDHRHFGYGRMQVLAAFINSLAVMGLAALLSARAVRRFWHPPETVHEDIMLWVAVAGLLVNVAIFFVLHRNGRQGLNIRAATLHVLGDLLSSAAVVFAALLIRWTGWDLFDPVATFAIATLLAWSAKNIFYESGHILLEGRPLGFDPAKVVDALREAVPEVKGIHHLHAWSLSGEDVLLTLHAVLDDIALRTYDAVLCAIKSVLTTRFHIRHSTVQVERAGCADHPPAAAETHTPADPA